MNLFQFDESTAETELRLGVIECGRVCYAARLMTSNDGNISVRLSPDRILITASGAAKGRLVENDLLVIDPAGAVIAAAPGRKPSSETPMHLEVYRQRPDVRGVIHAHPVFATALTVAGLDFPSDILPEVLLTLGDVPTTEYSTPSSEHDAVAIRDLIKTHDAILLCQHGSLTAGKDLEQALINLERVEHVAEVFWRAQALGAVKRLTPEAREQLRVVRDRLFSA